MHHEPLAGRAMNLLLAMLMLPLSLLGCDSGSTHVHRIFRIDDDVMLYSKISITSGDARFECVRTQTGWCHYTLTRPACDGAPDRASSGDACRPQPSQRFALARGNSRVLTIAGIAPARVCIGSRADDASPECGTLGTAL